MSGHFYAGLADAQVLQTRPYQLAQLAIADLVESRTIGLIHGDSGLGKTFAVRDASKQQVVKTCWFDFPGRTSTKAIVKGLVEGVTRVRQDGTRAQLEERLDDALAEEPWLFVIDEAQRLYAESIEFLRHIWDSPSSQLSLLLVGGNGCWEVISRYPMVLSRLHRRIRFGPLTQEDVIAYIPQLHPIYRKADPAVLAFIDGEYAGGNLRNWANFTKTAETIMRKHGRAGLDRHTVEAAFVLLGQ